MLSRDELIARSRTVLKPRRFAGNYAAGETRIRQIVAVWGDDVVLPPCGRCREFMVQVERANWADTQVVLGPDRSEPLSALLPHPYDEVWGPPPEPTTAD